MITVTSQGAAKLYYKGTSVEISSIVGRLQFSAPENGKILPVMVFYYDSATGYSEGATSLSVSGTIGFIPSQEMFNLALGTNPETYDNQDIIVAHNKIKSALESAGYLVVISGI